MNSVNITWKSAKFSHKGNVRSFNEDSCLVRDDIHLWVVADGMGGHAAGDVASNMITNSLEKLPSENKLSNLIDKVEDTLIGVNSTLLQMAKNQYQGRTIGSTVVSMVSIGEFIAFLWAGDSRIYRIRDGKIQQLTRDHSEVQSLIDQGLLRPEEAEFHPSANIINRAIGATEFPYLSTGIEKVMNNDIYILCSDGLYRDIKEEEMLQIARIGTPNDICQDLMSLALSREAKDNITIVVARSKIERD